MRNQATINLFILFFFVVFGLLSVSTYSSDGPGGTLHKCDPAEPGSLISWTITPTTNTTCSNSVSYTLNRDADTNVQSNSKLVSDNIVFNANTNPQEIVFYAQPGSSLNLSRGSFKVNTDGGLTDRRIKIILSGTGNVTNFTFDSTISGNSLPVINGSYNITNTTFNKQIAIYGTGRSIITDGIFTANTKLGKEHGGAIKNADVVFNKSKFTSVVEIEGIDGKYSFIETNFTSSGNINLIQITGSNATFIFNRSKIDRNLVFGTSSTTSNLTIRGSVQLSSFSDISSNNVFINRYFPLNITNTKNRILANQYFEVYDKNNNLIVSNTTDSVGLSIINLTFNSTNFRDNFTIRVLNVNSTNITLNTSSYNSSTRLENVHVIFPDNCNPPSSGNWNINNSVYCIDEDLVINSNITVNVTGKLHVVNSTFKINAGANGDKYINITSGGLINITKGSNITRNGNANYNFWIHGGGKFESKDSSISYAGYGAGSSRGILFEQNANDVNITNTTIFSEDRGLTFDRASNFNLTNNTINVTTSGIYITGVTGGTIERNIVDANQNEGISVLGTSSNVAVTRNTIMTDSARGISTTSSGINISYNNITTQGYGIYIYGSASSNDIIENNITLTLSGARGIFLDQSSSGNMIVDNRIRSDYAGNYFVISQGNSQNTNLTINKNIEYENAKILLAGNITISPSGNLTLRNMTLQINSISNGQYKINSSGGLYVFSGSNITRYENFNYNFTINSGSKFEMKDSHLSYVGDSSLDSYFEVNADDSNITNSTIKSSGSSAIYVTGQDATIYNNTIETLVDGVDGVVVLGDNSNVSSNHIISHGTNAVAIDINSLHNKVFYNNLTSNDGTALRFGENSRFNRVLYNNLTTTTTTDGIVLFNSNSNIFSNNTLKATSSDSRGIVVVGNNVNNYTIENNTIHLSASTTGTGIFIAAGQRDFRNNTIKNNNITAGNAVSILGSSIHNNVFSDNVIYSSDGIEVKGGNNNSFIDNNFSLANEYLLRLFDSINSNLTITKPILYQNGKIQISGNITVRSSGNLTLNNVTLQLNSTTNGEYKINSSGSLYIYNSNITNATDAKPFDFFVNSGSNFELKNSSVSYAGWNNAQSSRGIKIATSNANVTNNTINSTISSVHSLWITGNDNKVTNNKLESNGNTVYIQGSSNEIKNNKIKTTQGAAYNIRLFGSSATSNEISNNNISNGEGYGIGLEDAESNTIFNNTIYSVPLHGIYLISSNSNNISDNNITMFVSNQYPLVLSNSRNNNIIDNNLSASYGEYIIRSYPGDGYSENNNLTITKNIRYERSRILLEGNVTIGSSGNLTLNNVTLQLNSTTNGEYKINSSGSLNILNSSNITKLPGSSNYSFYINPSSNITVNSSYVSYVGSISNGIRVENPDVFNFSFSNISNGYYGIYFVNSNFENITSLNFSNNVQGDINLSNSNDIGIIDSNFDKRLSTDDSSSLKVYWTSNVKVKDGISLDSIEGVSVTVRDSQDDVIASGITYSNGSINRFKAVEYSEVNMVQTNDTHEITATHSDYRTNVTEVNITKMRIGIDKIEILMFEGVPPYYYNNETDFASGIAYSPTRVYTFKINWTDYQSSLDDILIEHNFTGTPMNYTMTAGAGSDSSRNYTYEYTGLAVGRYYWKSYGNDTPGNMNQTGKMEFEIVRAPTNINIYLNDTLNANISLVYPSDYNATAIIDRNNEIDSFEFSWLYEDGTTKSIGSGTQRIEEIAHRKTGKYQFTATIPTTQNYTGFTRVQNITIDKRHLNLTLYKNGLVWNEHETIHYVTTNTSVNVTVNESLYQDKSRLWLDDVTGNINEQNDTRVLAAREDRPYNYSANFTDTENFTISPLFRSLTVRKAHTNTTLLLNDTHENKSYSKGEMANLSASVNITSLTTRIHSNYTGTRELLSSTGTNPTQNITNTSSLTLGDYEIFADWTGDQENYSISSSTLILTVDDRQAPKCINNKTAPASGVTYRAGASYQFNITCTDNDVIDTVLLEFNGVNYTVTTRNGNEYYYNITDLRANESGYEYRWFSNDSKNNINHTTTNHYVIKKIHTGIDLYENDTLWTSDRTQTYSTEHTNVSGTINVSSLQNGVRMYLDDDHVDNPENRSLKARETAYNYTAVYDGNENYTSSRVTRFLTINKANTKIDLFKNDTLWSFDHIQTYNIQHTNVSGNSNVTSLQSSVVLYLDDVQVDNPENRSLAARTSSYNYTGIFEGNENYTSSRNTKFLTINRASVNIDLYFNESTTPNVDRTITYPSDANATAIISITSQYTGFNITRNDTCVAGCSTTSQRLEYIGDLSAGHYRFNAHYSQTENYTGFNRTNTLIIQRGSTNLHMEFNGTKDQDKLDYQYPAGINATAYSDRSDGHVALYNNKSGLLGNLSGRTEYITAPAAGHYNFTAEYHHENYTATNISYLLGVRRKTPQITDSLTPTTDLVYPVETTYTGTVIEGDSSGQTQMRRDGVIIQGPSNPPQDKSDTATLSAGTHTYNFTYLQSENYTEHTENETLTIAKGPTNVTLLLNGTHENKSYNRGAHANITSYLNISGRLIRIYNNDTNYGSSTGELDTIQIATDIRQNITDTSVLSLGDYLITGNWSGDQNYSTSNSSLVLTVYDIEPPEVTLVSPNDWHWTNRLSNTFRCDITDNDMIDEVSLYTNSSGTWTQLGENQTGSGQSYSASFTENVVEGHILWNCRAYDSSNNNAFALQNRTLGVDVNGPHPTQIGSNKTGIYTHEHILLHSFWTDNWTNITSAILETNETGTWRNHTTLYGSPMTLGNDSRSNWTNFTWINDSIEEGTIVGWRIHTNDSLNNQNSTPIRTFNIVVSGPPDAPENVNVSFVDDRNHTILNINWTDNSTNEDWFYIERSTNGGAYVLINKTDTKNKAGRLCGGSCTYNFTDTGLNANTNYSYLVYAGHDAENSSKILANNTDNMTRQFKYTRAQIPGTQDLYSEPNAIRVTIKPQTNPSYTAYYINATKRDTSQEYWIGQNNYTTTTGPYNKTYVEWGGTGGVVARGFEQGNTYCFTTVGRNGDGISTIPSGSSCASPDEGGDYAYRVHFDPNLVKLPVGGSLPQYLFIENIGTSNDTYTINIDSANGVRVVSDIETIQIDGKEVDRVSFDVELTAQGGGDLTVSVESAGDPEYDDNHPAETSDTLTVEQAELGVPGLDNIGIMVIVTFAAIALMIFI